MARRSTTPTALTAQSMAEPPLAAGRSIPTARFGGRAISSTSHTCARTCGSVPRRSTCAFRLLPHGWPPLPSCRFCRRTAAIARPRARRRPGGAPAGGPGRRRPSGPGRASSQVHGATWNGCARFSRTPRRTPPRSPPPSNRPTRGRGVPVALAEAERRFRGRPGLAEQVALEAARAKLEVEAQQAVIDRRAYRDLRQQRRLGHAHPGRRCRERRRPVRPLQDARQRPRRPTTKPAGGWSVARQADAARRRAIAAEQQAAEEEARMRERAAELEAIRAARAAAQQALRRRSTRSRRARARCGPGRAG